MKYPVGALLMALCCSLLLTLVSAPTPLLASDLELATRSMVRIENIGQRGDWATPWTVSSTDRSYGSGFVIEDGLIMTNAHVVSDSRLLIVQFVDNPKPYRAEVVHVAHDCDLALIRVEGDAVTDRIAPLTFGGNTALGDLVDTLGFPHGGIRVASSRGVVSRIEQAVYVHSGIDLHSVVQTDASINPGASGGPVIHEGRVVGVAFQTNFELENTGYFVPMEVIGRFLEDVEDGTYDGYPELGVETANLLNPAQRARLTMKEDESGVRVHRVVQETTAWGQLEAGDVLLSIDGRSIANDGTIADAGGRVPFGMLVDRKFIGDRLSVRVLRSGARIELELQLDAHPRTELFGNLYDQEPRYFVYAGLVFVELSLETLNTYDAQWYINAPKALMDSFTYRRVSDPQIETRTQVVLLRRLKHRTNGSMAWFKDQVLQRTNGVEIDSLEQLIEAIEGHSEPYHLLEFAHGRRFGVIDRIEAEEVNEEIMEAYGVPADRRL